MRDLVVGDVIQDGGASADDGMLADLDGIRYTGADHYSGEVSNVYVATGTGPGGKAAVVADSGIMIHG